MRKFEKISYEQFKKDISDNKTLYEEYELPKRSTKNSAGYDIKSTESKIVKPMESIAFTTGVKVCMESDEVLYLYSRSSQGYKYNVCLTNSVGVIDSDYYNNSDNEGHIKVKLTNLGDSDYTVNIGDKIAQGVFMKYLTVTDEEIIKKDRTGGIGSTDKEK